MKKFMKFCLVLALVLIIAGCALYIAGRTTDGGTRMNEVLSEVTGDRIHLNLDPNSDSGWGVFLSDDIYDIDDASVFNSEYPIWQGDTDSHQVCKGDVEELDLEIGGSMVEIKDSEDEYVYIESSNAGKTQVYVEDGVLYVRSLRPSNLMNEIKNSTITLYLPQNCQLSEMKISLGAGLLKLKGMNVESMAAQIGAGQLLLEDLSLEQIAVSLGAGEVKAENVTMGSFSAEIGAGNLELNGIINGDTQISCSMGNVSMKLQGQETDFDYELNCVAGNMEIGDDEFSGASVERNIDNGATKNMTIECTMGNVEVKFE